MSEGIGYMPQIKSAKKRVITSEKARVRNKTTKTKISSLRRKFKETVAEGDKEKSTKVLSEYFSVLDKAVKKGVMKKNTADRTKSRATTAVAAL